jgi:iron complex outermembrane receptor protein
MSTRSGNRAQKLATFVGGALSISSIAAAQQAQVAATGQLEEVVVTANKRVESAQDVASSVSVERGDALIERGQSQLSDYAAYMPGFNVSSMGSPGQNAVSLRGISSTGSTSAVGTYLDDAPVGASAGWANGSMTLLDMLPYDLDRLEVLRGPQGTLYGAGSMGGLIKYVLKPASTTQFQAQAGAETDVIDGAGKLGYSLQARLNAPLIDHVLGVSASIFDKYTPGYMSNIQTDGHDTNDAREYGGRLAALWTPAESLSVKLTVLSQDIESDDLAIKQFANAVSVPNSTGALILQPTNPLPALTESTAYQQPFSERMMFYSGTVDWDVGPFSVISATSWSSQRSAALSDFSPIFGPILGAFGGTGPGLANFALTYGLDKFTQELRLTSPQGQRIEWLVGLFDTHESSYNNQLIRAYNENYTPMSGAIAYPPGILAAWFPMTYDEYAGFGDLTWHATDSFSISGGARYAHNDQDWNTSVAPGPLVNEYGHIHVGFHEGVPTWMGNMEYHINKDMMTYVRVATGYRPGGPNSPIAGVPETVGADKLTNYELGLKSSFLDRRAQVDMALYHIDWTGIQLQAIENGLSYGANGGKAISQGVEFSGTYLPIPALTLGLNEAYTDSHLTSTIPAASYLLTGYQLPDVPKESASFTADYSWSLLSSGWTASVGGGYRYTGKQWLLPVETDSAASTPTIEAPSYSVIDLRASVRNDHFTLRAFVRNLANRSAAVGAVSDGISQSHLIMTNPVTGENNVYETFLTPRTVGVAVDYKY